MSYIKKKKVYDRFYKKTTQTLARYIIDNSCQLYKTFKPKLTGREFGQMFIPENWEVIKTFREHRDQAPDMLTFTCTGLKHIFRANIYVFSRFDFEVEFESMMPKTGFTDEQGIEAMLKVADRIILYDEAVKLWHGATELEKIILQVYIHQKG